MVQARRQALHAVMLSLLCCQWAAAADNPGSEVECPCCHHICRVSSEIEKETKHCWEVQLQAICIPKVRFPWEKSCEPKGARLKYVKVLKKHEYECDRCKYKWTPICVDCGQPDGKVDRGPVRPEPGTDLPPSPPREAASNRRPAAVRPVTVKPQN